MFRFYFIVLILLSLAGCVSDRGIQSRATPLDVEALSTPHHYSPTVKNLCTTQQWWEQFNDPQLNQLILTALADGPKMNRAESRIRQAEAFAQETAAALWPYIDASGYRQRERFSATGLVPPPFNGKTFNIADVGLNFNYEFDFWGKNREGLAASISEQQAVEAEAEEVRLILAAAVTHAYFQLQGNRAQQAIAESILKHRQKLLTIIQDRAKHGIQSSIPVESALANSQSAAIAAAQWEQAAALSKHQLAVLLGKNPLETTFDLNPLVCQQSSQTRPACHKERDAFYAVPVPTSIPAHVLAQRPDIIAARLRAEAAAHAINVAKAGFYPDINLTALLSFQSVIPSKLFDAKNQNNDIGAAFNLPIFDAGARRANLGAKYAEYDVAVYEYNQTILNGLQEVADQLSSLDVIDSQLLAQKEALAAIEHNDQLTTSLYRHGIIDYLPLLDIHEKLLEQQATQLNLDVQHLQASVALIKALGGYYQGQNQHDSIQ